MLTITIVAGPAVLSQPLRPPVNLQHISAPTYAGQLPTLEQYNCNRPTGVGK